MLNAKKLKTQFPIFKDKTLVFLDSAATSQKPKAVIDAITNYYENFNANVHRGIYSLSEKATQAYNDTRETVKNFINAKHTNEIVFTRNTTESINLVAYTWGEKNIKANDEIIVSALEHHSNLVPWQELCKRKKAKLKVIPLKDDYTLDIQKYEKLLTNRTKLVAITAMSNVTGTITPLKKITTLAHKKKAKVLVDGAQSAAHSETDVQKLNCDFFVFSGHKCLGPTGVGILYAKEEILNDMPPFLFGGDMIEHVGQYKSTFAQLPNKFEAGTPSIAEVVALKPALEFLQKVGLNNIHKHEQELKTYAIQKFSAYPEVTLHTPPPSQSGSNISFTIEGIHPHDIATIFNSENVCIRAGHHCAQPLMKHLNVHSTARMSFYLYNTREDIDRAEKALIKTIKTFK
jgi:cysteine desulfurase / selenocysteine lyase